MSNTAAFILGAAACFTGVCFLIGAFMLAASVDEAVAKAHVMAQKIAAHLRG